MFDSIPGEIGCAIACTVTFLFVIYLFWSDSKSTEQRQKQWVQ